MKEKRKEEINSNVKAILKNHSTDEIGFLIMKSNININLEIFENFMDKFGIIFLLLLIAIMYFISYKVSCKVYKNKEE